MIKRILQDQVISLAKEYPVVAILGPRQSGKTTLALDTFPNHRYLSFEDFDMRDFADKDPRGFLEKYENQNGVILDEFQNAPQILSYIQTYVDMKKPRGYFILTGSQNYLVLDSVTQSLAGRIGIVTLLPLSIAELAQANHLPNKIEELAYMGGYPQLQVGDISPERWFPNYLLTYLERDVRQLTNIGDLSTYKHFMTACAARVGQLINYSQIASECEVSVPTITRWFSALEAGYIIQLVQPYYKNITRRLVKTPKLYFNDTGLVCFLLGIASAEEVSNSYLRGALIENLIMSDLFKQYYNSYRQPRLYFWRDERGNEIDCVLERMDTLTPIEIKGSKTQSERFFENAQEWVEMNPKLKARKPIVVFGGSDTSRRKDGDIISWRDAGNIIADLYKS